MTHIEPGQNQRETVSLYELFQRFGTEEAAREWFENLRWANGRYCPRCGSTNTHEATHKYSPYRCRDCRKYFSVKTGSVMEASNVPLTKWVIAIYLEVTSIKGIAANRLKHDIEVSYKTAWFMLHRIREGFTDTGEPMDGPVEVDETYIGGKRKNMSNAKRRQLRKEGVGRGAVGKAAVVGVKDRNTKKVRAKVVSATDRETLHGFIRERVADGAKVYTDEAVAYEGLPFDHETVKHSVGEYVRDMAHTNGIESFWSMLKRGYVGTYHKMSAKHLHRYVSTFAARHGMRQLDTMAQLNEVVASFAGRRLLYRELVS